MTRVTLAGVSFSFAGQSLDMQLLRPPMVAFFHAANALPVDLCCHIEIVGPCPALAEIRPEKAWECGPTPDGCFVLLRRFEDPTVPDSAAVCYRMRISPDFTRIVCDWHPHWFNRCYGSFENALSAVPGYMLMVLRLAGCGGLFFHASAAEIDGAGVLFAGPSGRGKSTIARCFAAAGHTVLSDERPVVRPDPESMTGFRLYGTPWPSSGNFYATRSAPCRAIYFLEHGPENQILPLTPREALYRLLDVTTVPWQHKALFDPMLATLDRFLAAVPCRRLIFRPDAEVVDVVCRDLA